MRLTAIAAVGANGVIGGAGGMLWHLPEDFARFKRVTMGGVLIMGRKTYESIGRPLPGRTTIVLSTREARSKTLVGSHPDVHWVASMTAALELAERLAVDGRRVFLAGGGQIYRLGWSAVTDLDITEVRLSPEGDAVFPKIDPEIWVETSREVHEEFDFVTYRRR